MKVKKVHHTLLIIIIVILIILVFYFSIPKSNTLSIFSSNPNKFDINTTISKTSITRIAENDETITYRLRWLVGDSTDSTCNARKYVNVKFSISNYEALKEKPILPTNVPNQFDVKGENIFLTGLKAYQYPCEDNQQFISIKNLIKEQGIVCDLVDIEGKPIISCNVNVVLKSPVPINYYGNVDGHADIIFKKEVAR